MGTLSGVAAAWVLAASSLLQGQNAPTPEKPKNQVAVNQDSLTIQDFSKRVDEYVKLRKRAQGGLPAPKPGHSAGDIKQYQLSLAENIRTARPQTKPGDIFTPEVSRLFRKLIAAPFQSGDGNNVRASLRHAEPVRGLRLEVNQAYPQTSALQSTPPTLLEGLPRLPPELEYRLVGRELVLLDTAANLIVDLLPDALPIAGSGR